MTNIATVGDVLTQIAAGKAYHDVLHGAQPPAQTAAAAASGYLNLILNASNIGTTYPGTLQTFDFPGGSNSFRGALLYKGDARSGWTGFLYTIGTLNLAATGNQFTHDAATFPLLRTKYGQTSQPINLIPYIYITTATATTAPAFIIKDSGGGTGYVNQAGSNVVGSITFTLPSATTAAGTGFILMLENGDSAIRDIVQIDVTSAGSAGAATIYGFEPIAPFITLGNSMVVTDGILGEMIMRNSNPATATSGSVTAGLYQLICGSSIDVPVGYTVSVRANI